MRRVLIVFVVMLVGASMVFADAPRIGVVSGTVSDPNGGKMPGATVQLISERGSMDTTTGSEGEFRFTFVMPGPYTVRADMNGFQSTAGEIEVEAGGRTHVDLRLGEQMGEEIVVTAETPMINKYDVSGGGSMDNKELNAIFIGTQDYQTILKLYPGSASSEMAGGADVEGHQPVRMATFVDGVDVNFVRYGGASKLRIPTTALGQVKLETSASDAEYSRNVGGVSSVIVRSGSNTFHGSLSAIFNNPDWYDEYDLFPLDTKDKITTQYELSLGGPIVRDKLFFFVSFGDHPNFVQRTITDGTEVEYETTSTSYLLKADYRPNPSHSLAFTGVYNPVEFPFWAANGTDADIYSATVFNEGGDLYSLKWGWAINDNLLLDTHVAVQTTDAEYSPYAIRPIDPDAHPSAPGANPDTTYHDLIGHLQYNASSFTWGVGPTDFPRDQANLSLNWFTGTHDIKAGLDWQDVEYRINSAVNPIAMGRGYNPDLPGGFTLPIFKRVYLSPQEFGGSISTAESFALFVRDRFTLADRWTFNLGLRVDMQEHATDTGKPTVDSTDYSPRIAVAYDVRGDSTLLVTASLGRYVEFPGMQFTSQFNEIPAARSAYDQYRWNRTTQAYDVGPTMVRPSAQDIIQGSPNKKDELTLGAEWAFRPNWVAKLKLLYWEQPDLKSVTDQFDSDGNLIRQWGSAPGAKAERQSATVIVRRRFRDNWFVSASYAYSRTEGSCYMGVLPGFNCLDNYGELLDARDPATGEPFGTPPSIVNRDGKLLVDRPHVFRTIGSYLFQLGRSHSIMVGGTFRFQSGRAFEHVQTTDVVSSSGVASTSTEYLEQAGSRRLEDYWQLDLNATWRFRITGQLEGYARIDAYNITNEQEVTRLSPTRRFFPDDPLIGVTTGNIQVPRRYRALVGLSF
jgi:hypothetical protein